jgi:NTE family protein
MKGGVSRTALVFAGGGSLGAAEVGMLKVLVAAGVRPDLVVGASVGAINAAQFAGDPTPGGVQRLEEIWRTVRRQDVFPATPVETVLGLFAGRDYLVTPKPLKHLIASHLPYEHLENARIECCIVATDALNGSEVRFSKGPAVDCLLASAAIPGVFPPVRIGGRHLVDGGVANNTPISTAVDLGADRIIVLPTGFSCALTRPPHGALAIALHALNLLVARQLVRDARQFSRVVNLVIIPPLCPLAVSPYDFSRTGELIDRAAEATSRWLNRTGLDVGTIPGALTPHEDQQAAETHTPAEEASRFGGNAQYQRRRAARAA